ncbi:LacI family DNA-binding transcriptional regulator [Paenibacillus glycanilyticus]|uniref:LacI family transcriptional regulator n=1 Tax=Paenibacillus glycanilyticus TaxID=126569 RepID=A0ABQ6GF00_9BACL|nr:LacI family DNA-binding transcriptional regulator [Paenibacillus glycanilyticus]GLX69237.1 LacI family transcriptional regulator [Paenibacillus glycanilyticus]
MQNHVTMRDIASRLGVSSVTVSKALGDKDGVSEELKQKIKELAKEMGYRFNAAAKAMKDGYTSNIGVVIAERYVAATQSFYLQFYQSLATTLEEEQYSGILHMLSESDEEQLVLPRIYHDRKADGFIVLGQLSKDYLSAFYETGIPLVFLDFYTDDTELDYVITDNFYGMYEMTNYLIQNGHRELAFVGNIHSTSSIQDRFLGFYKSLLEHRIALREDYIISDRDEKGKLIEFALPEPMPTAFVCNCDQVAYMLIQSLRKRGVEVPKDCSVVGFDNDMYATLAEPGLTTVEVDRKEMAKAAVTKIVSKIRTGTPSSGRVLVRGNMISRESVKTIET